MRGVIALGVYNVSSTEMGRRRRCSALRFGTSLSRLKHCHCSPISVTDVRRLCDDRDQEAPMIAATTVACTVFRCSWVTASTCSMPAGRHWRRMASGTTKPRVVWDTKQYPFLVCRSSGGHTIPVDHYAFYSFEYMYVLKCYIHTRTIKPLACAAIPHPMSSSQTSIAAMPSADLLITVHELCHRSLRPDAPSAPHCIIIHLPTAKAMDAIISCLMVLLVADLLIRTVARCITWLFRLAYDAIKRA